MRISVFEIEGWEKGRFECLAEQHEVRFDRRQLDAESAADHADAEAISTFIYSDISSDVLERFGGL